MEKYEDSADRCRHPRSGPRRSGPPRPVTVPSSDKASVNPMLTPAPSEAARPTKNARGFDLPQCGADEIADSIESIAWGAGRFANRR